MPIGVELGAALEGAAQVGHLLSNRRFPPPSAEVAATSTTGTYRPTRQTLFLEQNYKIMPVPPVSKLYENLTSSNGILRP